MTSREIAFNFSANDISFTGQMLDISSDLNKIFGLYNQNEVVIYIYNHTYFMGLHILWGYIFYGVTYL